MRCWSAIFPDNEGRGETKKSERAYAISSSALIGSPLLLSRLGSKSLTLIIFSFFSILFQVLSGRSYRVAMEPFLTKIS